MLRNFSVTTNTIRAKSDAYAGFLAGTAGFATTTRRLLEENEDRIIELAAVSRPILDVLAKYSPEYPCLLQGLAQSNDFIGDTFANGELHITLEVTQARKGYQPGEEPALRRDPRTRAATACRTRRGRGRATRFRDGTKGNGSAATVPGFLVDPQSGLSGSAEEQAVVDALVGPQMGLPAEQVPDLATLLFGPMARGTAVGQS